MTERGWRRAAGGLAIGLLLALTGLVVTLLRVDTGPDQGTGAGESSAEVLLQAERDAEEAARAAAVRLTTYSFETVASDFSWADQAGTPRFQERYAEVSAPIIEIVTASKARAEGVVDSAAATAQDANSVTVLLFVDQTLTRQGSAERQLATPRLLMSMVRSGATWLVDDVVIRDQVDAG